jgi:hypothetical protein
LDQASYLELLKVMLSLKQGLEVVASPSSKPPAGRSGS